MHGYHPRFEKKENLDHWVPNSWTERDTWDWIWQPRKCSFCGGTHPDDAIRLLSEGWRINPTDKSNKDYLEPPLFPHSPFADPIPPAVVRVWHFQDSGQLDIYNKLAVQASRWLKKELQRLRVLTVEGGTFLSLAEPLQLATNELVGYLKRNPKDLTKIQPRQFEEVIAEVLGSFGWRVHLTAATRDGGYDIFAINRDEQADTKTSWLIECKKYAPERKVGVDVVRNLYGINIDVQAANLLIATTSDFTHGVHKLKASNYNLTLRDYEGVLEWIRRYRPHPEEKLYILENEITQHPEQAQQSPGAYPGGAADGASGNAQE